MANEVAHDVEDPQTGVSVWQRTQARRAVSGNAEATSRPDLRISPLGSGSDYTPFLQHLGVASLNVGYVVRMAGAPTTPSTIRTTTIRGSGIPASTTESPWRRPRGG